MQNRGFERGFYGSASHVVSQPLFRKPGAYLSVRVGMIMLHQRVDTHTQAYTHKPPTHTANMG